MSEDKSTAPETTKQTAAPAANQPNQKSPEDQLADKLCIISLVCYFAPTILSILFSPFISIYEDVLEDSATGGLFMIPLGAAIALGPLAAIILMIVARVKAPKNKFGKVLMWVYIALFILKIIAILFIIMIFGAIIASCDGAAF